MNEATMLTHEEIQLVVKSATLNGVEEGYKKGFIDGYETACGETPEVKFFEKEIKKTRKMFEKALVNQSLK
jgi:hypothetical protein